MGMMVVDYIFYMFAVVTVVAAMMVITTKNPVQSVLFLVLTFFSTAGIFILLEAEFIAAILVMVYMGAVAMLFLFVVMLLDVDFATLRGEMVKHMPLGGLVGVILLVEIAAVGLSYHAEPVTRAMAEGHNTQALGRVLFTQYLFPFEVASLVLLVALIGAVVLTLRERKDVKRQNIAAQIARRRDEAVELKKVASGEGA